MLGKLSSEIYVHMKSENRGGKMLKNKAVAAKYTHERETFMFFF